MQSSRRKERITACALLALSLLYSFGCLRLKIGALENPGAGLIPRVIGFLLLVFTAIYCYQVFRSQAGRKEAEKPEKASRTNYLASLGIAACVVAYPFLLRNLKFLLATFIVVFAMLLLLKYKRMLSSLLISSLITVASFLIFSRLLGVVLPGGTLEQLAMRLGL